MVTKKNFYSMWCSPLIAIWPNDVSIPKMANRTGYGFFTQFRIKVWIRFSDGTKVMPLYFTCYYIWLLILKWNVTVNANPKRVVFCPLRLKLRILPRYRMERVFPLFINIIMTFSTFFSRNRCEALWRGLQRASFLPMLRQWLNVTSLNSNSFRCFSFLRFSRLAPKDRQGGKQTGSKDIYINFCAIFFIQK